MPSHSVDPLQQGSLLHPSGARNKVHQCTGLKQPFGLLDEIGGFFIDRVRVQT